VRPLRPGKKAFIPLFVVFLGLIAAWISRRDDGRSPPTASASAPDNVAIPERQSPRADFDFYLLALTSHPAFCADGHAREPECRAEQRRPISIHGLWPERIEPGKYPRDCASSRLDLDQGLEVELEPLMPGMADGLHEHEWRKHGTCTGLDDDEYFRHTLEFALRVDSALGARLAALAGDRASADELREFAEQHEPGIGSSLTFHCRTLRNAPAKHRQEPYLIEIRQCLENDGPGGAPKSVINCATVNRRDQGCGRYFNIAAGRS
jgi:ribonuclease I